MNQDVVTLLQQLVRIPSVNPDNAPGTSQTGEQTIAVFLSGWLESIGAEVSQEEIRPGRPNLIARFAPRDGRPRILLGPHLDTVGVAGMTVEPFGGEIRDGRLWGRGASDTKGPMAAMLWALHENRDLLAKLPVAVDFVGFMGEESGQWGSKDFAKNHGEEYTFALVFMHRRYRARASGISGQLEGHGVKIGEKFVVVTVDAAGKQHHTDVSVTDFEGSTGASAVTLGGKTYRMSSDASLGAVVVTGLVNGEPFTAQVERGAGKNPLALRVAHNGTQVEATVLSPLGAGLMTLMPYKAPPDLSKYLMSPMPGLLVEVSVQLGQQVQAGEKLAVIEAMKMENVLFAARDGVVGKVSAGKGESLSVDQIILEFA